MSDTTQREPAIFDDGIDVVLERDGTYYVRDIATGHRFAHVVGFEHIVSSDPITGDMQRRAEIAFDNGLIRCRLVMEGEQVDLISRSGEPDRNG